MKRVAVIGVQVKAGEDGQARLVGRFELITTKGRGDGHLFSRLEQAALGFPIDASMTWLKDCTEPAANPEQWGTLLIEGQPRRLLGWGHGCNSVFAFSKLLEGLSSEKLVTEIRGHLFPILRDVGRHFDNSEVEIVWRIEDRLDPPARHGRLLPGYSTRPTPLTASQLVSPVLTGLTGLFDVDEPRDGRSGRDEG